MAWQGSSWRQDILARHQDAQPKLTAAAENEMTDVDWERFDRKQWIELAQTYDPKASLAEELVVRLVGESASSAALRLEWDGLLRPLQEAVGSATHNDVDLELAGFSKGSSVLHFRAVHREGLEGIADGEGPVIRETPLAGPVRDLLQVVDAIENEQDVRRWMRMLDGMARLAGELQRLHLLADFRFYARSGDVRGAQLTERGMAYIKKLAEPHEQESVIPISGRITELRESGHAKVKAGLRRGDTAYDVEIDPAQLTSMRLMLGQNVHWAVTRVANEDQLGRLKSIRYEFSNDLEMSGQSDLASAANFWPSPHDESEGATANQNWRYIVPNPDGGWDVKAPGVQRASVHTDTQADAIQRAKAIVRNQGGGEVRIHGQDGQIHSRDTVRPGNDPLPPKG